MANYLIKSPEDTEALATFLSKKNSTLENHIGYCGEKKSEILDTLLNDFSDLPLSKSFAVAYIKDTIVGAIGLDFDCSANSAEVWGPFIEEDLTNYNEITNSLLKQVFEWSGSDEVDLSFFVNKNNFRVLKYINDIKGTQKGKHMVLRAYSNDFINEENQNIISFDKSYKESFLHLHESSFTNTYYTGENIIDRLDDYNKLFIHLDRRKEANGYIYLEANPEFGEGSIEYIAVDSKSQRQGIGVALVRKGLHCLFEYENIQEISICVDEENESAIRLYTASGFAREYELITYNLIVNKVSPRITEEGQAREPLVP